MLISAKEIHGYKLECLDGEIGHIKEFYFDDRFWTVRYLVAETGNWLVGNQVLISPHSVLKIDRDRKSIAVNLSKEQVEKMPLVVADKPPTREYEDAFYEYYEYPTYWSGPYMWGALPGVWVNGMALKNSDPLNPEFRPEPKEPAPEPVERTDVHLRSTSAIKGAHISATDGELGHVSDFLIDDQSWAIRYLVLNTDNFWPGKHVLLSPRWIDEISWVDSKVHVTVSQEAIKLSPEYTPETHIDRAYEELLHQHYKQQGYWADEDVLPTKPRLADPSAGPSIR